MQIIAFIIFFIFAIWITSKNNPEMIKLYLILTCVVLVFFSGFRDAHVWADTDSYIICFRKTPSIFDYSPLDSPYGYNERGFHLLSVLIKTISNSYQFYFLAIAAITMYYVSKGGLRYSSFPLI